MDPILFALIIGWFLVRGPAEDAWYAAHRQESPRARARRELNHFKGGGVGHKLAHATADRISHRLANPKPAGPTRRYVSELWADALASATEHRRQRAETKADHRHRTGVGGDTGATFESPGGVHDQRGRRWWQWARPTPDPETWPESERQAGPVHATAERLLPQHKPEPESAAEHVEPVATRRWDGQPETPADTRFYELRESGYTGWIDHDGSPVDDIDTWIAAHRPPVDVIDAEVVSGPPEDPAPASPPERHTPIEKEEHPITDIPTVAVDASADQPKQITTSNQGGTVVSAPTAAEVGLADYLRYAEQMEQLAAEAGPSLETTIASLQNQEFGEAAYSGLQQAAEHFEAARTAIAESRAALEQANTVKDAYQSVDHAGTKAALLAE